MGLIDFDFSGGEIVVTLRPDLVGEMVFLLQIIFLLGDRGLYGQNDDLLEIKFLI